MQGSGTAGTVKSAGLPNITGNTGTTSAGVNIVAADSLTNQSGAITIPKWTSGRFSWNSSPGAYGYRNIQFDASRSNAIYGGSTTVQPPSLTMRYYIKY